MQHLRKLSSGLLLAALLLLAAGCGGGGAAKQAAADGPVPVSFQLGWYPESEYGGFYAAVQQGLYEEAGVDVTIRPGSPMTSSLQLVAGGSATFGAEKADSLLMARAKGIPVVAIAAIFHTSPQSLLFHADQNITGFDDIDGRTVFFVPGVMAYEYAKSELGFQLKEQVHPGSLVPFINDRTALLHGFATSEPCDVPGLDHLVFADIGYNTYENIIFTTEDVIRNEPELVRAFITASIAGWEHYETNIDEVNEYLLQFRPETTLEQLRCQSELQAPYIYGPIADELGLGTMTTERWQTLKDQLVKIGALPESVSVEAAFTNEFLPW